MSWKEKTDKAKRLHRTDITDWTVDGLYESFPNWSKSILEKDDHKYESFIPFLTHHTTTTATATIPSLLDAKHVSPKKFQEEYEAKSIPCVLLSIPQGYDVIHNSSNNYQNNDDDKQKYYEWKALRRWSLSALNEDDDLRERPLKCGEDDDGNTIRM